MLVQLATHFGLAGAKAMPISKLQAFLMQQKGDKDIFDYYEELLTILKELDYVQTTEATNETEDNINKQYWWLVASPKIWSFSKMKVGEIQDYTLYNENGNPRRIFQNFVNAKKGDIVIGYEANPVKQIVAIAEIDTPSDGQHICFKKVESLQYPIDYASFKDAPELKSMEFIQNKNGSLFKVAPDEYEYLIDLIRESNPKEENKQLKPYTQENFLNEVYMSEEDYTKLRLLLQNKKNIILQGYELGSIWGGSSYKFGIYEYRIKTNIHNTKFISDEKYAWYARYNKPTAQEAFNVVKNAIIKIATNASNGNFEVLDTITELGEGYRWKIAFLYSTQPTYPHLQERHACTIGNTFWFSRS